MDELEKNILVCTPAEMVDRLGVFADLGIDRVSLTVNVGVSQADALDTVQCIAEEVMPHFAATVSAGHAAPVLASA